MRTVREVRRGKMSVPTVTVVIPCFNHGRFVADAVRSCLAQESADVHVIVVNDGSNDGSTPEACDRCAALSPERVAVVHQKNRGLPAARNAGFAEAKRRGGVWVGEYLTFLDADDWIEPTFVTKLHAALVRAAREEPSVLRKQCVQPVATTIPELLVAAQAGAAEHENGHHAAASATAPVRSIDQPREFAIGDEPLAVEGSDELLVPGLASHAYCQERLVELHEMVWAVPEWDSRLMLVTNLHPVTTLIRRECFEAVGGFDESMHEGYEDWDVWLKFVERGWRGVRVREPLFIWRRHSQNTMIVEAGKRHERLYAQLVTNHLRLYLRHGPELLVLSNRLLRQSDANWLDESGEAIVVRDTRNWAQSLALERDAARNEIGVLSAARQADEAAFRQREHELTQQVEAERTRLAQVSGERREVLSRLDAFAAELAAAQQQVARLERKPAVRLSRALHRALDRMPSPVRRVLKWIVRCGARLVSSMGRGR